METLHKQTILELADSRSDICISIFIPTHSKGNHVQEGHDQILFKNQLQKVRKALQDKGIHATRIETLLQPLDNLLEDRIFWHYQAEGLAVFRSDDVFQVHKSPFAFEEVCHVNSRFLVRPLFRFAQPARPYYVLKLSKNGAALYKADLFSIEEMETPDLFRSGLQEVTKYYEFEEELQGRASQGRGGNSAMHRSDDSDNKEKDHLLADYFRLVDEEVSKLTIAKNIPLVLACVGYLQPIYQKVNTYPLLHESALTGNFEQVHVSHLHQMANELLTDYFAENQQRKITQYQNGSGQGLTSRDLREILESAVTGRVDTLFVRHDTQVWGHFDEYTFVAHIHDQPINGDESLVDQAILLTLRNGGEVYMVDNANLLPNDVEAGIGALYRFQTPS